MKGAVRVLVVATKAPWPPIDGGRLLLLRTLEGLAALGARPVLVAPVDPRRFALAEVAAALRACCEPELVAARPAGPARPASTARALLAWALGGRPWSIARHTLAPVRRRVLRLVAARPFDVVHAEQLQALAQARPPAALAGRIPVVLRAQNVESALWAAAGRGRALAAEARRLARWEGRAVASVDTTLALTAADAATLHHLAAAVGEPRARVDVLPAPFAAELPPGQAALTGDPPVVVLGSRGWRPNEDAVAWFTAEVWPEVRRTLPAAHLHVFGAGSPPPAGAPGISWHPAPADSAAAFAAGSIHVVPLRFGSGVRMKILEAWSRGVPVVSTAAGAAGLAAVPGRELLLAEDARGFAAALRRLHDEPALAADLASAGRAALRSRHDPLMLARQLLAIYDEVIATRPPER
jgi:hypothetical protein